MSITRWGVVLGFIMLVDYSIGKDGKTVPVLFWSPEMPMSTLPEVNMNEAMEPSSFHGQFLKPLMKKSSHSAVVFLQDKLHADDFAKYADVYSVEGDGGAFKNIKSLMESSFSLELPQVSGAGESVSALVRSFPEESVHSVNSAGELDDLTLGPESSLLILVRLSTDGLDEESALARNDDIIGSVCRKLTKRGIKYTALFTGQEAGLGFEDQDSASIGRHLLAEDDAVDGNLFNVSGMFLYLKTINVHVVQGEKEPLDFNITSTDIKDKDSYSGDRNDTNGQFVLSGLAKDTPGTDVSFTMNVVNQKDRWVVTEILLNVKTTGTGNKTDIEDGRLTGLDLDWKVPILYSFHCTDLKLFLDAVIHGHKYKEYAGTYVRITGFQFQPFNIQHDRFFNSVDCVPFFTSGILMGLFPTLLLLSILLGGTMMLLSLSIMDKYDDPKGKTIVVNTSGD